MFSPGFLAVGLTGKVRQMCSLALFGQSSAFLLGPGGVGILVESLTVSFFLGKGMKAADLSHFCLSKIPQRLEVESLLADQPCCFNVLVVKRKTGPCSLGYGAFLTIPSTLSGV